MPVHRFLTRVVIQDYKSIASCDVSPSQFSVLVGANGVGKSNFLDALLLIAESLRNSLEDALSSRGGASAVIRRTGEGLHSFGVRVDCNLPHGSAAYALSILVGDAGEYSVDREECVVTPHKSTDSKSFFSIRDGSIVHCNVSGPPPASSYRLYLPRAADMQEFLPVYHALSGMGFYNLSADVIRNPPPARPSKLLIRDGRNVVTALSFLDRRYPEIKKMIEEYFACINPGFDQINQITVGHHTVLEFLQRFEDQDQSQRFYAAEMSDGSLLLLGLLVALFQRIDRVEGNPRPSLIGIEEPETALHPAALEFIVDVLEHATNDTQVIITSHNTDLLEHPFITENSILTVGYDQGCTHIAPVSHVDRSMMRDRICTAGELLRMNQLQYQSSGPEQRTFRPPLFDFLP